MVESEKAQADFIKWKLVLVAGLGSASLGFSKLSANSNAQYLFCLIPLICAYVDLIYFPQTLRILVIEAFLRNIDTEISPELLHLPANATVQTRQKEVSEPVEPAWL